MLAKRYVLTANTSPEDWYLKADVHRTIWRRVTDFAAKHGRLIPTVWTAGRPLRPGLRGLRFLVILSPKARNLSPPRRGYRQAIANWRCD